MDELKEKAREWMKHQTRRNKSMSDLLAAFAASIQAEVEHQKANWEEMHRDCMKAEQQLAEARANRDTWMAEARELQRLKTLWQDETNRSVAEARAQAFKEAAKSVEKLSLANPGTDFERGIRSACHLISQNLLSHAAAIERGPEAQNGKQASELPKTI